MLTVACVWVRGNVPYGVEYVTRLQAMVRRHLSQPHRFVCLTDRPWLLPDGVDSCPIPAVGQMPGWWAKVRLFDSRLNLGDRVLSLDLDTLIVNGLDTIADYPSAFALVPHAGTFEGRGALKVVKRFNSSVMVFDRAAVRGLWDEWVPEVADRLWGDQDWIGERADVSAETMPAAWFPRLSEIGAGGVIPTAARVVLSKKPKNDEAAKQWPWFAERWRAA